MNIIRTTNRQIVSDPVGYQSWAKYFGQLYMPEPPATHISGCFSYGSCWFFNRWNSPKTPVQVSEALRKLKGGNATVNGNISTDAEGLRRSCDLWAACCSVFCVAVCCQPPDWKRSLIVSVKEKGLTVLQQCNVTLHTMPGKVLTHLLLLLI